VSIAQLIIRTLTSIGIDFNNVLALVSDNAAYMKKCFTDGLRGLLPNAVHVTCWAHILSLVGEEFRGAFELTDSLVESHFLSRTWQTSTLSHSSSRLCSYRRHHATQSSYHSLEYVVQSCTLSRGARSVLRCVRRERDSPMWQHVAAAQAT